MNIKVKRFVNRPVDSNCFVLFQDGHSNCIVIDPGTSDCRELIRFFNMQQLRPEYIILTHEHFDHIWGVNPLVVTFACKIICSIACAEKIVDRKGNMSVFYDQVGFQSGPADILIEGLN